MLDEQPAPKAREPARVRMRCQRHLEQHSTNAEYPTQSRLPCVYRAVLISQFIYEQYRFKNGIATYQTDIHKVKPV